MMMAPHQFDLFEGKRAPRVLIACEYSGTVRNAFLARGYDAWSCDLLSSEDRSNRHITGDARVHMASPSPDRWKERSRFFPGIADAMATQWGDQFANA